jgi:LPXTG-motif cell wall-anchored protein
MSDNSTATQSDQTGAAATTSDQNAASNSAVSSDQNANAADQTAAAENNGQASTEAAQKKLPQTASPLPFLGLLGMGSLMGGGLLARIRGRK